MRSKLPDVVVGDRYGRWSVIGKLKEKTAFHESLCLCVCDCGPRRAVKESSIKAGRSKSCGCLNKDRVTKHGQSRHGAATSWYNMLCRCTNPNNPNYSDYGGRGIAICDRWMELTNFIADMGERPYGATLDRIDVDGPYSPENCRWASRKQQCNNQRTNQRVVYNGAEYTIGELSDKTGISYSTLYGRIAKRGMSVRLAVETRIVSRRRKVKLPQELHG